MAAPGTPWTRPADVRAAVARRWQSGALLTAYAAGLEFEPLGVPIKGPAPAEIGGRLGAVQDWAAEWERAGRGPLRVEYRKVGGRVVGADLIPCRAWLDGYDQAGALLGVRAAVGRLARVAETTKPT